MANKTITVLIAVCAAEPHQAFVQTLLPRFQLSEVSSLNELRTFLMKKSPDIILLDPDQPDGDGIQWVASAHQELQERQIKVVGVTNRSSVREKILAFRSGMDDYLIYPVNLAILPQRLILLRQIQRTFDR